MPFPRKRNALQFTETERCELKSLGKSRTEQKRRTLRAAILLASLSGQSDEVIARAHGRPSISTVRHFLPNADHEAENRIIERREIGDLEGVLPLPGARELLEHLPRDRWTIVTSCTRALAEVRLRAKKLFISASLQVTGQLDLDEELNARISGLDCTGEGAMASVACGVLKPHLHTLDGREFSLMSLPLGEVRLRDVLIAVGDKLAITAEFGSIREWVV